jgi:hypothetical protein
MTAPSTRRAAPVVAEASGLATEATSEATSCGDAKRSITQSTLGGACAEVNAMTNDGFLAGKGQRVAGSWRGFVFDGAPIAADLPLTFKVRSRLGAVSQILRPSVGSARKLPLVERRLGRLLRSDT